LIKKTRKGGRARWYRRWCVLELRDGYLSYYQVGEFEQYHRSYYQAGEF
jgi:hypothetical protein